MKFSSFSLFTSVIIVSFFLSSCGNNLNDSFNYAEPERDEHGLLLARTDLKDANDVSDGYATIKELFTKLNSITQTQIEPMYKSIYYGEKNTETNEKIPTFVIVGDIHADEYNFQETDMKGIRHILWPNFLTENNEDANVEIDAVEILHKKFGITNIGLENEVYGEDFQSKIGQWLKERNIPAIGIESNEFSQEVGEIFVKSFIYSLVGSAYAGIPLETKWTPEEIAQISEDAEFLKQLQEENPDEFLKKHLHKTPGEQLTIVKDFIKNTFEKKQRQ